MNLGHFGGGVMPQPKLKKLGNLNRQEKGGWQIFFWKITSHCAQNYSYLNGSGPQGSTIGLLEYLAQSNNNCDAVGEEERFKFLDDLSILEVVNLLTIGISSYNVKQHVPSDVPVDNGYIDANSLKSQQYLDAICTWTDKQKMKLNIKKSNIMIFNPTQKFKFATRLKLNDVTLPIINKTKLLGTIITDDLKWNANTDELVKKGNQRMLLLRNQVEIKMEDEDKIEVRFK